MPDLDALIAGLCRDLIALRSASSAQSKDELATLAASAIAALYECTKQARKAAA